MWWIVWGIFVVLIIERGNLIDTSKPWFNIFSVTFELVSAIAGIGLSLGFPGV
jgi:Trk-type K+ transport system membrane component